MAKLVNITPMSRHYGLWLLGLINPLITGEPHMVAMETF